MIYLELLHILHPGHLTFHSAVCVRTVIFKQKEKPISKYFGLWLDQNIFAAKQRLLAELVISATRVTPEGVSACENEILLWGLEDKKHYNGKKRPFEKMRTLWGNEIDFLNTWNCSRSMLKEATVKLILSGTCKTDTGTVFKRLVSSLICLSSVQWHPGGEEEQHLRCFFDNYSWNSTLKDIATFCAAKS